MFVFFDFKGELPTKLTDDWSGASRCEHEDRTHVVIFRRPAPDMPWLNTDEVLSLWVCCLMCGGNYRSGYPCEMVHIDGSDCPEPFDKCPIATPEQLKASGWTELPPVCSDHPHCFLPEGHEEPHDLVELAIENHYDD